MKTTVVHCKKSKYDVYIGRPSKWGNPFVRGRDGSHNEVIQKYKEWVLTQVHLMAELKDLKGKTLGCFCSPYTCHGDILARLADSVYGSPETEKAAPVKEVQQPAPPVQEVSSPSVPGWAQDADFLAKLEQMMKDYKPSQQGTLAKAINEYGQKPEPTKVQETPAAKVKRLSARKTEKV